MYVTIKMHGIFIEKLIKYSNENGTYFNLTITVDLNT